MGDADAWEAARGKGIRVRLGTTMPGGGCAGPPRLAMSSHAATSAGGTCSPKRIRSSSSSACARDTCDGVVENVQSLQRF